MPCRPSSQRILRSVTEGGFLGMFRTMVLTVSLSCFKISSKMHWEVLFTSLKIRLFLYFQTFQTMKLRKRAQAMARTSLSVKPFLQLVRVLQMLFLSISVCWKIKAKESHRLEENIQMLRMCSMVSSCPSQS